MIADVMEASLLVVERLLAADDGIAASAALDELARGCAQAAASGEGTIAPARLAELRILHARCEAAADEATVRIRRALDEAGPARRATAAYGR